VQVTKEQELAGKEQELAGKDQLVMERDQLVESLNEQLAITEGLLSEKEEDLSRLSEELEQQVEQAHHKEQQRAVLQDEFSHVCTELEKVRADHAALQSSANAASRPSGSKMPVNGLKPLAKLCFPDKTGGTLDVVCSPLKLAQKFQHEPLKLAQISLELESQVER